MPAEEAARHAALLGDEAFLGYLDMMGLDLCRPSRVTAPLMVAAAGADGILGPRAAAAVARAHGVTPVEFPGMGHDLMLEPGWEAVVDAVAGWAAALPAN